MNPRVASVLCVVLVARAASVSCLRGEENLPPSAVLGTFLTERGIDRSGRRVLEEQGAWGDAKQKAAIRVLARLAAPVEFEARWRREAEDLGGTVPEVGDRFVRVDGTAAFVASVGLSEEQQLLAGQPHLDVVRIVSRSGVPVDVLVKRAPQSWPRWKAIEKPASACGLVLGRSGGPRPAAPGDGEPWPAAPAAMLLAANGISWHPATPLGELGMDYGLFEGVTDGTRLEAGDSGAFFGLLEAVGRAEAGRIEAAAGKPADILAIIDPKQKWFAAHRGDPLSISGIARRATRIAVDEPFRRAQLGTDHYWELFVFVDTPLLRVNDRDQDDYPIVCCVRTLPAGMPTGDRISERVRVAGFALKRYGYALPDYDVSSSQGERRSRNKRLETPLLVGREPVWLPNPSPATVAGPLVWVLTGITGLVGLLLAWTMWWMRRDSRRAERRARAELPDRVQLPGDEE